jgi:hypothetical protein
MVSLSSAISAAPHLGRFSLATNFLRVSAPPQSRERRRHNQQQQGGTPEMTKAANYYTLGKGRAVVCIEIIDAGRRVQLAEHQVDGKRAARAVAAQYNATPWNF